MATNVTPVDRRAPAGRPESDQRAVTVPYDRAKKWSGAPPPLEVEDELVGATLSDTYEIVGFLAEGGMGRVYEARHRRMRSKRFAVKVLHEELVRKPDSLERFQREAEVAASISSPHVCGVYDVARTPDGRPYLVAEYLDGVELGEHLDSVATLRAPVAVRVARQICRGLAAAHAAGVVHRDVKPENVFLTGDIRAPVVKILDFGISRLDRKSENRLTKTGAIMGTPAYMSPEQASGKDVDERTDVYAVGAILYRALTGKVPFEREDPAATLVAVVTMDPLRPRSIDPSIPEALEEVVQRAMAKEPADRYPTMADLDDALDPFDADAEETAGAPPIRHAAAAPRARRAAPRAGELEDARPKLVGYVLLSLAVLTATVVTAITGAMAAMRGAEGAAVTATEVMLVLLATAGTLVTPAVVAIRHVGRTVWNNTVKVLDLLATVRAAVVAAVAAYGLAALAVRVVDTVVAPLGGGAAAAPASVGAPAWGPLFVAVAAIACATVVVAHRWRARGAGRSRVARSSLGVLAVSLCAGALYVGFSLRAAPPPSAEAPEGAAGDARADAPLVPGTAAAPATGAPAVTGGAPTAASASASAAPAAPAERATEQELAAAQDATALDALAARYPGDPSVLAALAVARGRKESTHLGAMDAVEKLLAVAPEHAVDRRIRQLVAAVAQGDDPAASGKAFDLMKARMGESGPDILYDLVVASAKVRGRAVRAMQEPDVRKLTSAAARVAFELRIATSCAERGLLVARAGEEGDQRAATLLKSLSTGTKKGCGARDRHPCPPSCSVEAAAMQRAVAAIQQRVGTR